MLLLHQMHCWAHHMQFVHPSPLQQPLITLGENYFRVDWWLLKRAHCNVADSPHLLKPTRYRHFCHPFINTRQLQVAAGYLFKEVSLFQALQELLSNDWFNSAQQSRVRRYGSCLLCLYAQYLERLPLYAIKSNFVYRALYIQKVAQSALEKNYFDTSFHTFKYMT